MVTRLIVCSGKSAGRAISIKRNKLLIGRADTCDVRPLSEDVSRRHCAVHAGPAEIWVEDLGSRNGTFVNGERITGKIQVADGDMIRVGSLELRVSCLDSAPRDGSQDEVSRWMLAAERPAGIFDTTKPVSVEHVAAGGPAADDSSLITGVETVQTKSIAGDTIVGRSSVTSTAAIEALRAANARPAGLPRSDPRKSADSSRDAAAEALRKFFEKR